MPTKGSWHLGLKEETQKGSFFNPEDEISRESKDIDRLLRWLAGLAASEKNPIIPITMRRRLARINKMTIYEILLDGQIQAQKGQFDSNSR